MAIYKPTYCYPYSGNLDFCVADGMEDVYLKCKINTNNKKVTGYRLSLMDSNGEEIWSSKYISPAECFNGDTLKVPFVKFLSDTNNEVLNPNCLYSIIDLTVDYFITTSDLNISSVNNLSEVVDWNNKFEDSYIIPIGTKFLVNYGSNYDIYTMEETGLVIDQGVIDSNSKNIYIKYGIAEHNKVYACTSSSSQEVDHWLFSIDNDVNGSIDFLKLTAIDIILSSEYSWKITLFQGDNSIGNTAFFSTRKYYFNDEVIATESINNAFLYANYSNVFNLDQYDILITRGQILGSTGERLQIYPSDSILQKKWVQLGKATKDDNGIITDWEPYSTRSLIEIYDSTYGHIYPTEGDFSESIIEENSESINACMVYKHSNDPEMNKESDMVDVATPTNLTPGQIDEIIYHLFAGGIINIDGVADLSSGNLILLKDLTGYEYLHGVYSISANSSWTRSGSYKDWSQFLGKIILVKRGVQNAFSNFENKAQPGGAIGRITSYGIDAIRPSAARRMITEYNSSYYYVNYNGSNWSWTTADIVINGNQYNNSYIIYYKSNSVGQPPANFSLMYVEKFNEFSTWNTETLSTVCWLMNSFNGNSDFVTIASGNITPGIDAEMKGSNLYFIPEQGIILYPNYENLSEPIELESPNYIYIGSQSSNVVDNSAESQNITKYALNGFAKNSNTVLEGTEINISSPTEIDGVDFTDGTVPSGTTFIGFIDKTSAGGYSSECFINLSGIIDGIPPVSNEPTTTFPTIDVYSLIETGVSSGEYIYSGNTLTIPLTESYKYFFHKTNNRIYRINYVKKDAGPNGEALYQCQWSLYQVTLASNTLIHLYNSGITTQTDFIFTGGTPEFRDNISTTRRICLFSKKNNNTIQIDRFFDSGWVSNFNTNIDSFIAKPLSGSILGNTSVIICGTYKYPIIQYGVTQRVGFLNINSKEKTYIKPALNIEKDQYLYFTEINREPLKINGFNDKEYYINHEEILEPFSAVTNKSLKTPYKYEILSYFKESDYNPIMHSGKADPDVVYFYKDAYQYEEIVEGDGESIDFEIDGAIYSCPVTKEITFKSGNFGWRLRGCYKQSSGKRWEYYRICIFDQNQNLLQDTGKVYSYDFTQTFWGLNSLYDEAYAVVIIEDELGEIYNFAVKMIGSTDQSTEIGLNTAATTIKYNYNLQSIDLSLTFSSDPPSAVMILRKEENNPKYEIVDHVTLESRTYSFRDYNITNNRKYEYVITSGINGIAYKKQVLNSGESILTNGKCWSICELYPVDIPNELKASPSAKKKYFVDENNVWLFKYNGDFSSQNQNMNKSEQQTLGKYSRIGHGKLDSISGSVSVLLGSEIICGSQEAAQNSNNTIHGYQERLRNTRGNTPQHFSSNDSIDMLKAWRVLAQSKNPKLLKDVKGQSWIVQITSNQNSPMAHVEGQPDTISFSWTQIGDTKDIIIVGGKDLTLKSDY